MKKTPRIGGDEADHQNARNGRSRLVQALTVLVCFDIIWTAVDWSLSLRREASAALGIVGFLSALVMAARVLHGRETGWLRASVTAVLVALSGMVVASAGIPGSVQVSGGVWLVAIGAAGVTTALVSGAMGSISDTVRRSWQLSALLAACAVLALSLTAQPDWQNRALMLESTLSAAGITVIFLFPALVLADRVVEYVLGR